MLKKYIFENPELIKFVKTNFRYPKAISMASLYVVALLSLYFIQYILLKKIDQNYFKLVYVTTVGIEFLMSFYISTYLVTNAYAQEKEKGTLDFIRMTTIDRRVLALGKLLGPGIFQSFLILVTLPIVILSAILGNIPLMHFVIVHFHLVIYTIAFNTLGLLFAISSPKPASAGALSIGATLGIPLIFNIFVNGKEENPFFNLFNIMKNSSEYITRSIGFYNFTLPSALLTFFIISYLVFWFMKAIVRKLDDDNNKPLTKKQTLIFWTGLQFILTGIFWSKIELSGGTLLMIFSIFNFISISLISAILTPNFDDTVIFFNKKEDLNTKLWDSKANNIYLVFFMNIISTLFLFGLFSHSLVLETNSSNDFVLFSVIASITILFTLIYSMLFYVTNLFFVKNAPTMSAIIIAVSLFFPIPLQMFINDTGSHFNLFLLNPLVVIPEVLIIKNNYLNISNIAQIVILVITFLVMNFIILSKESKIAKKHKI